MLRYRLLLTLALPVMLMHLLWGWALGRQSRQGLVERLGGLPPGSRKPLPSAPPRIWLHAASNGEFTSARPVLQWLVKSGYPLILTTNSANSQTLARSWREEGLLPASTQIALAPLDARWVLSRFLRAHKPSALISIENEIWPNRFMMMAKAGHPCIILGARLSEKSARFWARLSLDQVFAGLAALSAQDKASGARFLSLGLPDAALLPQLNLKTAAQKHPLPPLEDWPQDWPREATWLAASTHEGEEGPILDAFARAHARRPDLRLILAPRHPHRAGEIARLITAHGFPLCARSEGALPSGPVYLADTLGEMGQWYARSAACFTGGSFVPKGGHTPFEPLAYGCAIFHGPHVENAREAYDLLDGCAGARGLPTPADLQHAMESLDSTALDAIANAAKSGIPAADPAYLAQFLESLTPILGPNPDFPPEGD